MPRIPIEVIYMQTAYQFAKLSYANRRKVGCVIVKDKQFRAEATATLKTISIVISKHLTYSILAVSPVTNHQQL